MLTKNIKYYIHESIENIDDIDFLNAIQEILERKYTPVKKEKSIPDFVIKELNSAHSQIQLGQYTNNSQADAIVDKWLNQ